VSALWAAAARAFFIALVLSPIIRDIFRSYNVVDQPGRRKVHAYPVPRLGGIAIAIAYAAGLLPLGDSGALQVLPGAAMIFFIGAVDDIFTLKPFPKLAGQIAAAGIAYWSGLRIENVADVAIPVWLGLPLTIFWLLVSTNALNLIDGLDGMCAAIGSVGALSFFFAGRMEDNSALQQVALVLAAALIGFIGYNWNPATMFLGDSGALLVGFLLGCFGVMSIQHGPGVFPGNILSVAAVPVMILGIPLLDLGLSIIRRLLKRQPMSAPDRLHMHHRLLDRGLTPRRAVLVLSAWAVLAGGFSLALNQISSGPWPWILIAAFCILAYMGARQLRYAEFDVAKDLLFQGGFRRALARQAWIRNLADALDRCRTDDEWWTLVSNGAAEAGWTGVTWTRKEVVCRERVFNDQRPAWSFAVELADGESLRIDGPLQSGGQSMDLIAFADIVRASLSLRQQARQTALSS
jgi:UDP-GlcNAc:undecaprenyl-phosphate/decaprenyl-phosphate GlcNAc-1-phosphate transferase